MKKTDIVRRISDKGFSKTDVSIILETFMDVVKDAIETGEEVTLRGFGTFKTKFRKTKVARNIKENKSVVVPEHYIPYFKPASEFEDRVKNLKGISKK